MERKCSSLLCSELLGTYGSIWRDAREFSRFFFLSRLENRPHREHLSTHDEGQYTFCSTSLFQAQHKPWQCSPGVLTFLQRHSLQCQHWDEFPERINQECLSMSVNDVTSLSDTQEDTSKAEGRWQYPGWFLPTMSERWPVLLYLLFWWTTRQQLKITEQLSFRNLKWKQTSFPSM